MTGAILFGIVMFGLGWLSNEAFSTWERKNIEKSKVWTPTNKVRR